MKEYLVTWMTGTEKNNDDAVHRINISAISEHQAILKVKLEIPHGYNFCACERRVRAGC